MGMGINTNRANLGFEYSYRHDVQNPTNSSNRVLLPLEPDFSNMSDSSVVIEPPDNNWKSDNRQTSQASLSGHISRRNQSRSLEHQLRKSMTLNGSYIPVGVIEGLLIRFRPILLLGPISAFTFSLRKSIKLALLSATDLWYLILLNLRLVIESGLTLSYQN